MTEFPAPGEVDPQSFAAFDDEWGRARMDLARDGVARARASADTVQKAAAAVGVIYAGLLGLAFSVAERPLTLNAVVPAIFLALAVFLPMVYHSFVGEPAPDVSWDAIKVRAPRRWAQVDAYIAETNRLIATRSRWLRAGVTALGVAIFLLPLPFVSLERTPDDLAAWPEIEPGQTSSLDEIRYTAEVAEVRDVRTEQLGNTREPLPLWLGLSGLVVGVAAVYLVSKGREQPGDAIPAHSSRLNHDG